MAKQRNRGGAASGVFPDFPYNRKFTREEIAVILDRARRLGDAMRDGVAPSGATLFIPGDMFEMWMVHGALAGVVVDESRALIRARRLPDKSGRLADSVEWVLKKDDTPERAAADAEREADRYVDAINAELDPAVAAAIRRRFVTESRAAEEYLSDDPDADARRDTPRDFGPPRLVEIRPDDKEQP